MACSCCKGQCLNCTHDDTRDGGGRYSGGGIDNDDNNPNLTIEYLDPHILGPGGPRAGRGASHSEQVARDRGGPITGTAPAPGGWPRLFEPLPPRLREPIRVAFADPPAPRIRVQCLERATSPGGGSEGAREERD